MEKFDKTGTRADLSSTPSSRDGGSANGTRQDTGTRAPLSATQSSSKFSTGGGAMNTTGTKASLSQKESKGYESASTPMSKRTYEQYK